MAQTPPPPPPPPSPQPHIDPELLELSTLAVAALRAALPPAPLAPPTAAPAAALPPAPTAPHTAPPTSFTATVPTWPPPSMYRPCQPPHGHRSVLWFYGTEVRDGDGHMVWSCHFCEYYNNHLEDIWADGDRWHKVP
ncbi:hypothetical protein K440DRAFT_636525 [Wilcoxina mikolae CBS 423.85]|nr:hypothetical protein K440DRAFT_636525 [Wilcoxina mikolae CBS 423.85]